MSTLKDPEIIAATEAANVTVLRYIEAPDRSRTRRRAPDLRPKYIKTRKALPMRSLFAAIVLCLGATAAHGQSSRPEVTAIFVEEAPRVDGNLDDSVWQGIEPITDFIQIWPDDGALPTERSEVRIAYDRDHLYFAFKFFDGEPDLIRAKNLERGGRNDRDDHAYIGLDTYLDRRNAYLFEINALGTQDDATVTDEGITLDSFSWDAVFRSETVIDDEGWSMEVSIPFRQLRFPRGDEVSFGLMLSRMINRKNERVMWPRIGLEFGSVMGAFGALAAVSQYGTLTGLKDIRRGRNMEFKPYVIAGHQTLPDGPPGVEVEDGFTYDFGADFKYGISSNQTLDLSVNTDFAQVEADNVQINLTRFSLFFPEKREFFLERSGLFEHGSPRFTQTFFSRRIGLTEQMLAGARFTGQVGRVSVGLLNIETGEGMGDLLGPASTNNTVARLRTTIFPRATTGVIYTGFRNTDRQNEAFGVDAQYRFWGASDFSAWYTEVRDNRADRNAAGHASIRVVNDLYGAEASYSNTGRFYDPALGFVRRRDYIRYAGALQYTPLVEFSSMPFIRRFQAMTEYSYITGQDRELQSTSLEASVGVAFNRRDNLRLTLERSFERLDNPFRIRNAVIEAGDYSFGSLGLMGQTDSSRRLYGGLGASTGTFYGGDRHDIEASVGFRHSQYLSLEAELTHSILDLPVDDGRFDATILNVSVLAAASRKLFATALIQYDNFTRDLQANIRVDWIHTPGSDLFFVFNTSYHFTGDDDMLFDPRSNVMLNDRLGVAKLTYLVLL